MAFDSLEQRMLQTYLDTFPPYVPDRSGQAPEAAQRQLYDFMEAMYRTFAANPAIWFTELHEDDAHPNRFNKSSYGKPKLIVNMRKVLKTMDGFLAMLFTLGADGCVEGDRLLMADPKAVGKKHRAAMERVGLRLEGGILTHDGYPAMFAAWRWMAARPGATMLAFSRCMFDPGHAYTSDIFRRLSGNAPAFDRLEAYLLANGYERVDCNGGQMRWDYVRCHGDASAAPGSWIYDHNYTGVAAEYEHVVGPPQCFALRIQQMRRIVPMFDRMPDELKDFVVRHTKRCDACGYCVMRNKNRPVVPDYFAVPVEHRGQRLNLCPVFPGCSYCWTSLDDDTVAGITAFLSFMERELFAEA